MHCDTTCKRAGSHGLSRSGHLQATNMAAWFCQGHSQWSCVYRGKMPVTMSLKLFEDILHGIQYHTTSAWESSNQTTCHTEVGCFVIVESYYKSPLLTMIFELSLHECFHHLKPFIWLVGLCCLMTYGLSKDIRCHV